MVVIEFRSLNVTTVYQSSPNVQLLFRHCHRIEEVNKVLTRGNIFVEPIFAIVTGYLLVVVDDVGVVEIAGPAHERIIITSWPFSCPAYHLPRRVAGAGCRYQEDDETGQQEPAATAGQSQGGGKCAHRPRGASQPPKPTTDGASTSFSVAFPSPLPPSFPATPLAHPLAFDAPEKRLTPRSPYVRARLSVSTASRRIKQNTRNCSLHPLEV